MPFLLRSALAMLLLLACTSVPAGVLLEPAPAPEWEVSEWINGGLGTLADQRGKIVVIEFFQLWCPVCNDFSMPLMKRWQKRYGERADFLMVSIHTVFEGFDEQNPMRLRDFVTEKQILHPVGIDRVDPGSPYPMTMQRFNTGGTPHIVVVDRQGMLRFSHFGYFDPEPVDAFLDRLLDEKEPKAGKSKSSGSDSPRATPSIPTRRPTAPRRSRVQPPPEAPIVPRSIEQEEPAAQQEPIEEEAPEQAQDPGRQEDPAAEGEEEDPDPGAEGEQDGQDAQREGQPEAQAEAEEPQEEAAEEEAPKDPLAVLSGSYRLRIEQSSKSCGDISPVQELIAQITVTANRFEVGFSRAHLGIRRMEGSFDPTAQRFSAVLDQKANYGAAVLQLHVESGGRFFEGPNGPEVEFEYRYSQQGDAPDSSCDVEGHGTGASVRRR